ncbi:50S ribosomal protein L7/L12-serine acetyltransferase [Kluyvera ascorbata]|uniref:50S ribosomal protein L7/L12-serine acetyltransferase n=1 Tax=Kluyvera ascorbata TaxID=51288 RepID=UPI0004E35791|nr:50S ribosomal protein L7/L12-serine acetyltransferase [Kluyvera ascorbata]EJG2385047.1 50S ribosomal protein L7/L12-serine acetyltransferase [Kluyvera ascorbata]KFD06085.1 ribosomal protein L7p-serine acetyltransferase [Kluyvera ascorbata ATCC 33433]MDT8701223.1 50S ribosomal protein L7/L12-serine acetyltransferase [Kluyvera ascorbata]MDU1195577.1 50S ribosomal protein L7/L12-serine acetyltransferase [Kluyvera ascorbata]MDZ4033029.1 50S ribosomal protein L7/L12-serine acetyltransferase [Klu
MTTAEIITVNDTVTLHAVNESHVTGLFELVMRNKVWLQQTLNWPQFVNSEQDSRQNVQGNMMLHQRGIAKMFLIFVDDTMAGVLSFNQIEPSNKTGYIGYWLDEDVQGKGILSASLQAFVRYYAERGEIRRFVIKCRVDNLRSNQVALRNGFALEGCLRQAEFLNGVYYDQNIYALIVDDAAL